MSKNYGAIPVILAAALMSSCGKTPEGKGPDIPTAPKSTAQDEGARIEFARRTGAEWMRGGAWRIVGTGIPGRPAAIAIARDDTRLLIPAQPQGYEIHSGNIDCGSGDFMDRKAMRSASDAAAPAISIDARPPAYAGEAVRAFCARQGTQLRGGVPQAMTAMREIMRQEGGMGATGLKGIRP
jgi:hypothetical protein